MVHDCCVMVIRRCKLPTLGPWVQPVNQRRVYTVASVLKSVPKLVGIGYVIKRFSARSGYMLTLVVQPYSKSSTWWKSTNIIIRRTLCFSYVRHVVRSSIRNKRRWQGGGGPAVGKRWYAFAVYSPCTISGRLWLEICRTGERSNPSFAASRWQAASAHRRRVGRHCVLLCIQQR